jgi:hypothetical protein
VIRQSGDECKALAEGEAALADRTAYVREVNRHLTSSEAAELFVEAPDHVPADADEAEL